LLLSQLGRLPEGIAELRKACELDPVVEGTWAYLGFFLTASGQYAASREALATGMRLEHGNMLEDHYYSGVNELRDRNPKAAMDQFALSRKPALRDAGVALAQYSLGHPQQSQAALEALIREHSADEPYTIATVFAWRGERDKAFEWLDRAYSRHHTYISRVKVDPLLDGLHADPRFGILLRKMGFQS
jgi:tetratricopeptide (TPR) repeat protein